MNCKTSKDVVAHMNSFLCVAVFSLLIISCVPIKQEVRGLEPQFCYTFVAGPGGGMLGPPSCGVFVYAEYLSNNYTIWYKGGIGDCVDENVRYFLKEHGESVTLRVNGSQIYFESNEVKPVSWVPERCLTPEELQKIVKN